MNTAWLLWGLLFGSIGVGFLIYGRKQRAVVPMVCGLSLMAYPYFVSDLFWLVLLGVALSVAPIFVK